MFIFGYAERLRHLHNEMAAEMNKRVSQLFRTKKYRKLLDLYKKYSEKQDKVNRELIGAQIRQMRIDYGISFEACSALSKSLYGKYNVLALFGITTAENIWMGLEKILFGEGEVLSYKKRFNLPTIRSKQSNRGVVIKVVNGQLLFALGSLKFHALPGDRFQTEEMALVVEYSFLYKIVFKACRWKASDYQLSVLWGRLRSKVLLDVRSWGINYREQHTEYVCISSGV